MLVVDTAIGVAAHLLFIALNRETCTSSFLVSYPM